jgi:hypothetical protein
MFDHPFRDALVRRGDGEGCFRILDKNRPKIGDNHFAQLLI